MNQNAANQVSSLRQYPSVPRQARHDAVVAPLRPATGPYL
jgi:hypothetical protein